MTRGDIWCFVCGLSRNKNPDVKFYKFPGNIVRRTEWLLRVGREDMIDKPILYKSSLLCEKHFDSGEYGLSGKRLKKDSVPIDTTEGKYKLNEKLIEYKKKQAEDARLLQLRQYSEVLPKRLGLGTEAAKSVENSNLQHCTTPPTYVLVRLVGDIPTGEPTASYVTGITPSMVPVAVNEPTISTLPKTFCIEPSTLPSLPPLLGGSVLTEITPSVVPVVFNNPTLSSLTPSNVGLPYRRGSVPTETTLPVVPVAVNKPTLSSLPPFPGGSVLTEITPSVVSVAVNEPTLPSSNVGLPSRRGVVPTAMTPPVVPVPVNNPTLSSLPPSGVGLPYRRGSVLITPLPNDTSSSFKSEVCQPNHLMTQSDLSASNCNLGYENDLNIKIEEDEKPDETLLFVKMEEETLLKENVDESLLFVKEEDDKEEILGF